MQLKNAANISTSFATALPVHWERALTTRVYNDKCYFYMHKQFLYIQTFASLIIYINMINIYNEQQNVQKKINKKHYDVW